MGRLGKICRCGSEIIAPYRALVCTKCGAACCSTCAYVLDSATYCTRCAESVIDADPSPAGSISWRSFRTEPPGARKRGDRAQWIILVARDQHDLFAHLARAFARDEKVEIIMDRRKDYRRNPPGIEERLRIHGAALVKGSKR